MADKESNAGFKTKRTHGTNDVAEKILLNRNEVFADVVNGCLFDGRRAIKAGMLETHSRRAPLPKMVAFTANTGTYPNI